MESSELEAEGEALRRTLERIDFLLNQGFISEEDAACRKQGAMDNFCLAPMIDRHRLHAQADRVVFGPRRDNIDLPSVGSIASLPAAAVGADSVPSGAGLSAVDSDTSLSGSSEILAGSGKLPPARASGTDRCGNPDAKQSKRQRLTEVGAVESERLLAVETSGLLPTSTPECEAPGCHLLSTCGHGGGVGNVRVCAQHCSPDLPNDIPIFAPVDPEDPKDPKGPAPVDPANPADLEEQQGPDGTNPLKIPDVPRQSLSQPQSQLPPQPQPQLQPQPQREAQPPSPSCNTDLAAQRATTTTMGDSIMNSINTSSIGINSTSNLPLERPTEPRLLVVVPVNTTTNCTVNSTTAATDAQAVSLAPIVPGLLAVANPTPTPTVRVSSTSCEGVSSTENGGGSTACGGVLAGSRPISSCTMQMMQMPIQMAIQMDMQMNTQMNTQMPSVEAEPTPPTVPIPADLRRGSCEWRECSKEPHYAVKGQRARTCFGHKEEDWVHVSRRRCDKDGCPRGAYFSLQGSTALFCSAHRTPAMVDVVNLRRYKCHTEGCQRQAYYNFLGLSRSKAKFCSTHKLPDMLNVRHRLCEHDGCRTTPTYSFAGDRPRFCASHKTEAMVDTKSKTCAYVDLNGLNCLKCRLYGLEDGKATFCFAHKSDGMINIRQARKRKAV